MQQTNTQHKGIIFINPFLSPENYIQLKKYLYKSSVGWNMRLAQSAHYLRELVKDFCKSCIKK